MENPNMWELWLKHTVMYTSKVWAVCLNCFFLLTSLVTHGQVTATPVCVTRTLWASIVSPFSACQCRAPTAVSPGSSWSTRQMAAVQHSRVVSFGDTELNVILYGLLFFSQGDGRGNCLWWRWTHMHYFHVTGVNLFYLITSLVNQILTSVFSLLATENAVVWKLLDLPNPILG